MVSGKYSALSGALAREQSIANISANLANVSTVGYKKSMTSFSSLLRSEEQVLDSKGINYNRVKDNYTDFSQGPLQETGNHLDLAIVGEGFFKIKGTEGNLLTRKGNFQIDPVGRLLSDAGRPVLSEDGGEIVIPRPDINSLVITEDGTLYVLDTEAEKTELGKIAVVSIDDKVKLQRQGDTAFSLPKGTPELPATNFSLSQGSLEVSNVNMTTEMARMINDNRTHEAYHKVLKSYSALGEQLDDLGSLG